MAITIVLFSSLFFLLALSIPIAVSIGTAVALTFVYTGIPLEALAQRMYAGVDSFTLLAIPFFMLAGSLMEIGGMSRRLVRFANAIVGTLAGGLAHVQVLASAFFAALSGSAPATTAAIGSALIPEMKKEGYPAEFAAAIQSVAGTIGTIIPPSIPMVVYCVIANESIGKMFAAGFIPGLIYAFSLMVVIYVICKKRGYGKEKAVKFSFGELWSSFLEAIWALLVPIIILGGIYSGWFTPTEAGAVAVLYGLFAGIFIYKELNFNNITKVFTAAATNTAMVLLIVSASSAFSWLLSLKGVGVMVGNWFASTAGGPISFLIMVNILLLFMGCFIETLSSVLILTPVLLPVAVELGINPILFGIVMIMNLSLGMSTPPVGENIYIAASIAGVSFEKLVRNLWPFIAVALVVVLIITFVPSIALFLPSILYP